MTPFRTVGLGVLLLFVLFVTTVRGQDAQRRGAAPAVLRAEAVSRIMPADTLLNFRTRRVPSGRIDVDEGILRAAYRLEAGPADSGSPRTAAREILAARADAFGWAADLPDLELDTFRQGPYSSHVEFRQTYRGLPVYNRRVKVNLDASGRPTMVLSGYAAHLKRVRGFDPSPALTAAEARAVVAEGSVEATEPELMVYPSKDPRLVWRLVVWADRSEWEALVDARSGEVVQLIDRATHGKRARSGVEVQDSDQATHLNNSHVDFRASNYEGTPSHRTAPGSPAEKPYYSTFTTGRGYVFDPDPLTTAGVDYGGDFTDQGDSDVPVLNAQRIAVDLPEISLGSNGLYRLEGPYVRIDGSAAIGGKAYVPPGEADPASFTYTRSDDRFEAVMVYYHIDKSQRYLQTLNVGFDIQRNPIRVNPHGYGDQDNSRYWPGTNVIAFGTGGIDDAEDAGVIWHEYAHALLEGSMPGILNAGGEGESLHEGWADYWAGSYVRDLIERGVVPPRDWRRLYHWDGNNVSAGWCGRWLNHDGWYPDHTSYTAPPGCFIGGIYPAGLLWATTLMDIYDHLGRGVIDRLALASHFYLNLPATFPDAAEALIQADRDLYGGANSAVLIDRLGARGYIDPSVYGPKLVHAPLPDSELHGQFIAVEVEVSSMAADIDSVVMVYGTARPPGARLTLERLDESRFGGLLQLPEEPGTVYYYLEAVDLGGRRSRLPGAAPTDVFSFNMGPDHEPPVIRHDASASVPVAGWPLELYAEVEDNLGVDSVWAEYELLTPDGEPLEQGTFPLTLQHDVYQGFFPVETVEEGMTVLYRIRARDSAAAGNTAVLPTEGSFSVSVVGKGVLRVFNFEGVSQGLQASGVWARGEPSYGLHVAHSGRNVWATVPDGRYPAQAHGSSLILPAFNLDGVAKAYLVFWHWYDFEHDGRAEPGRMQQTLQLWDGGNVKISTDGGATWSVLEPEGGYNGIISRDFSNPLGGEHAFGGYSYGWRQEVAALPQAPEVRIRFDFGTDDDNQDEARFYAGWHLDDVVITTERPQDDQAPVATLLPETVVVLDPERGTPVVEVDLEDDTGIESAILEYEVVTAAGVRQGRQRLEMNPRSLRRFSGRIAVTEAMAPSDRIEYRIRVRDFDENEVLFPRMDEPAFVVEYRQILSVNALLRARQTGLWIRQGSAWTARAGGEELPRSSLVLEPLDLAGNSAGIELELHHRWRLAEGAGGNVKVSVDGARTWQVLEPVGGYSGSLAVADEHPMRGEAAFIGEQGDPVVTRFDVTEYAGRQLRLRVDFGTDRSLSQEEYWRIDSAQLQVSTRDEEFEVPRELSLHAAYPNPFTTTTTVGYTLPETTIIRLSVYDMIGRRVALLVHAEQGAGTYTHTFDGSGLASGVYMLFLETEKGRRTQKMIIAR